MTKAGERLIKSAKQAQGMVEGMTDEEHAEEIRLALFALNQAIRRAGEAGLKTEVETAVYAHSMGAIAEATPQVVAHLTRTICVK